MSRATEAGGMTVYGASCPLPRVRAMVSLLIPHRPFGFGGGNRSSCRVPDARLDAYEIESHIAPALGPKKTGRVGWTIKLKAEMSCCQGFKFANHVAN